MKLENTKSKHPQLVYEAKLYKILQGAVGEWGAALLPALPQPAVTRTPTHARTRARPLTHTHATLPLSHQASPTSGGTAWRPSPRAPTMSW
jgi:hypothetical protein